MWCTPLNFNTADAAIADTALKLSGEWCTPLASDAADEAITFISNGIFFIANKVPCAPVPKLLGQPTEPLTMMMLEEDGKVVEDLGVVYDADQPMLQMGKEQKPTREFVQLW